MKKNQSRLTKISEITCCVDENVTHTAKIDFGTFTHKALFKHSNYDAKLIMDSKPEAFVIASLHTSMLMGQDIWVDDCLCCEFMYVLNNDLIPLLASRFDELHNIKVIASVLVNKNTSHVKRNHKAIGMSCGVDSLSALLSRNFESMGVEKFDYLLFNNVGAFGDDKDKMLGEYNNVKDFAKAIDVNVIFIDSNIRELSDVPYDQICSLNNAAAAFIISDLFDDITFASAYPYQDIFLLKKNITLASLDSILFPLLSYRGMRLNHIGHNLSRSQKLDIIVKYPEYGKYLQVCTKTTLNKKSINCGVCKKCSEVLIYLKHRHPESLDLSSFDIKRFEARLPLLYVRLVYNAKRGQALGNSYHFYNILNKEIPVIYKGLGTLWAFIRKQIFRR